MSTAIWPPIDLEQLVHEQAVSQARELEWLLLELRDTLQSLKAGLEECSTLLAPAESGSTLVLSSVRSESLKGLVTRVGTRIVKGVGLPLTDPLSCGRVRSDAFQQNIKLRLASLPPPRGSSTYDLTISASPQAPTLVIQQLTTVRTLINACLDVIDVTTWTGDSTDGNFVAGQFRLLYENIQEARQALKGYSDVQLPWWENPLDDKIFEPPLPPNLSFNLSIFDAALVLEIRTLEVRNANEESSLSGFSIRDRLAAALGAPRLPAHDEAERTFAYKGHEVRVKEKIRVESQDPALLSAMAKLNALEHNVALSRKALDIVMGHDE